nr:MAG TPA: hypothetical protein [Caudoviricetes sp.]
MSGTPLFYLTAKIRQKFHVKLYNFVDIIF